jgi:hypothetical protein
VGVGHGGGERGLRAGDYFCVREEKMRVDHNGEKIIEHPCPVQIPGTKPGIISQPCGGDADETRCQYCWNRFCREHLTEYADQGLLCSDCLAELIAEDEREVETKLLGVRNAA